MLGLNESQHPDTAPTPIHSQKIYPSTVSPHPNFPSQESAAHKIFQHAPNTK